MAFQVFKLGQDGPKMVPGRPKMAQDGPKMAQDGSKMASRLPKMAQDGPKDASNVALAMLLWLCLAMRLAMLIAPLAMRLAMLLAIPAMYCHASCQKYLILSLLIRRLRMLCLGFLPFVLP